MTTDKNKDLEVDEAEIQSAATAIVEAVKAGCRE